MQVYTSATHWGVFTARVHGGDIAAVAALASDTNPAPQLQNLPGAVRHRSRIANPAVRRGWLQHGPGPSSARGAEEFVEVSWDELIELLASELRRTVDRYGNERSMAAPTAGPAPDGSTTRKARCTGSSTWSAGTPHPGTATAPARPK